MYKYFLLAACIIALSCGSRNTPEAKPTDPADSAMHATHQQSSSSFPKPEGALTDTLPDKDSTQKTDTLKRQ